MRILYALNAFRPLIDGVGVSIERQAIGLCTRGHEIAILAPATRFADSFEDGPNYRLYRLRAIPVARSGHRVPLLPGRGIGRVLDDFLPDIVVVSQPFLLSRATWHLARARGYPLVGITSIMPQWFYYNVSTIRPLAGVLDDHLWRMFTGYYNRCNHVVGVTDTALRFLQQHGLHRPATVISNGVHLETFRPRPRDADLAEHLGIPRKPTILYTGRLDAEKCMDVWIRAIPRIRERVDAHFIIGGEGTELQALEGLVATLGVRGAVTFSGFQPDAAYPRLFSLADAFAITSPAELQSVVTLEAAASGLPIIAARAGALPELVRDGENGRLVPLGDPGALADAILEILTDPKRRRQMGRASRGLAEGHDFARTLDAYERVYQRVCREPWRVPGLYRPLIERG